MPSDDAKDAVILSLAEKLFICSRLLTCAAERLHWHSPTVQALMRRLEERVGSEVTAVATDRISL